jgi:hypothetical protein
MKKLQRPFFDRTKSKQLFFCLGPLKKHNKNVVVKCRWNASKQTKKVNYLTRKKLKNKCVIELNIIATLFDAHRPLATKFVMTGRGAKNENRHHSPSIVIK